MVFVGKLWRPMVCTMRMNTAVSDANDIARCALVNDRFQTKKDAKIKRFVVVKSSSSSSSTSRRRRSPAAVTVVVSKNSRQRRRRRRRRRRRSSSSNKQTSRRRRRQIYIYKKRSQIQPPNKCNK
jgi:hypothetical protein